MEITIKFSKEDGIAVKTSEQMTLAELVGILEIAKAVVLNDKMDKEVEPESEYEM